MPLDDLQGQRRSIGAARFPGGCEVGSIPGAYATLVIVLTPEGPIAQGSALTPDDLDEIADAARDTALAVRRGEVDLVGYVTVCWERRRRRRLNREARALLRTAGEG